MLEFGSFTIQNKTRNNKTEESVPQNMNKLFMYLFFT